MAGVMPWERGAIREFHLTPALHSIDEIAHFDSAGGAEPLDVHLKIDTGMNRLGTRAALGGNCQCDPVCAQYPRGRPDVALRFGGRFHFARRPMEQIRRSMK